MRQPVPMTKSMSAMQRIGMWAAKVFIGLAVAALSDKTKCFSSTGLEQPVLATG